MNKPESIVGFVENLIGKEIRVNQGEPLKLDKIITTCDASGINFLVSGKSYFNWLAVDELAIAKTEERN